MASSAPIGGTKGLSTVEWRSLPPDCRENFSDLFKDNGGAVIYFFAVVHKVGWKVWPEKRVLMVSHSAVFQCMATKDHLANRCIKIENIAEVLVTQDNWLGIRDPTEYDLLIVTQNKETLNRLVYVLRVLHKGRSGKDLLVTTLSKDEPIKAKLKLKKPPGWKVTMQPVLKQSDVWKLQQQRKRKEKEVEGTACGDLSLAEADDLALREAATNMMQAAPGGLDGSECSMSPRDSPVNTPRLTAVDGTGVTRAASPSPILPPAAKRKDSDDPDNFMAASTSSSIGLSRHDTKPVDEELPTQPPQQPHPHQQSQQPSQKPLYCIGDMLEVHRSSGLWEPCTVYHIEGASYVVKTANGDTKQIFFDEHEVYLRRPAVHRDSRGRVIVEGDLARILRPLHADGTTIERGQEGLVVAVPGDEPNTAAAVEVDGTLIDVRGEDLEVYSDGSSSGGSAAPRNVAREASASAQTVHHADTAMPPAQDVSPPRPKESAEDRGVPEPSPPPPPPPAPTAPDRHSPPTPSLPQALQQERREPTPHHPPVHTPDTHSNYDHGSLSPAARRWEDAALYPGAKVVPTEVDSPAVPAATSEEHINTLLSAGEFGKLGSFVSTLCEEYRKQVAFLSAELSRKTQEFHSVERGLRQQLTVTSPQQRSSSAGRDDELRLSVVQHELRKSEEMVSSLRNELSTKNSMELDQMQSNDELVMHLEQRYNTLQQLMLEREDELSNVRVQTAELERDLADANETIAFLKQKAADAESSSLRLQEQLELSGTAGQQKRIEELEEQVLALEIANEAKQTDALLLREAIVMAERRNDQLESHTNGNAGGGSSAPPRPPHAAPASQRVVDMSPAEVQTFLREVLQLSPETCEKMAGLTGNQLLKMPLGELTDVINERECSVLTKALGMRGASVSPSASVKTAGWTEADELKELTQVAWILGSRSKMVEDVWNGYELVSTARAQMNSAQRHLRSVEASDRVHGATDTLVRAEQLLKSVVTDHFMDFEKLHLGVIGHKPGGGVRSRSKSPMSSMDLKSCVNLSPVERRLLAKLTSAIYRNSAVRYRGPDGRVQRVPHPLSKSPPHSSRSSSLEPNGQQHPPVKGFEQVMYLTPPANVVLPKGSWSFSSGSLEGPVGGGGCTPPRRSSPLRQSTTPRRSPAMSRPRQPNPIVAFGRSALPRPESPPTRRRPRSVDRRTASAAGHYSPQYLTGPPVSSMHSSHYKKKYVVSPLGSTRKSKAHQQQQCDKEKREQSPSLESKPDSVPLSAWTTDLKPAQYPFGRS